MGAFSIRPQPRTLTIYITRGQKLGLHYELLALPRYKGPEPTLIQTVVGKISLALATMIREDSTSLDGCIGLALERYSPVHEVLTQTAPMIRRVSCLDLYPESHNQLRKRIQFQKRTC